MHPLTRHLTQDEEYRAMYIRYLKVHHRPIPIKLLRDLSIETSRQLLELWRKL